MSLFKMLNQKKISQWYEEDQLKISYSPTMVRTTLEYIRNIKAFINNYTAEIMKQSYRLLDAGCGDGVIMQEIIKDSNLNIVALDYNKVRTMRVKKIISKVVNASLTDIPLKTGKFDIVLLNNVLEHIQEDMEVLHEIRRILAPGGIAIIGVPNEGCTMALIRNNILQRWILKDSDHVQHYTKRSISKKLRLSGLTAGKVKRVGFFMPYTRLDSMFYGSALGHIVLNILCSILPSQSMAISLCATKEKGSSLQLTS